MLGSATGVLGPTCAVPVPAPVVPGVVDPTTHPCTHRQESMLLPGPLGDMFSLRGTNFYTCSHLLLLRGRQLALPLCHHPVLPLCHHPALLLCRQLAPHCLVTVSQQLLLLL